MIKILTWNINGIRACKIPLKQQLDSLDADIICLQETKVTRDQLDELTAIVDGYNSYFSFSRVRSGYSGVATFAKDGVIPVRAEEGLSGLHGSSGHEDNISSCYTTQFLFSNEELGVLDNEGRCIMTEHKIVHSDGTERRLVIINVYCPRADQTNADRIAFKLDFYKLLQLRADDIVQHGSHVIVLGDINTCHKKIDHCDPEGDEEFDANPGRRWMSGFVRDEPVFPPDGDCTSDDRRKFIDVYRMLHPSEADAFTNWCTTTGARATNFGRRLDYILADASLAETALANAVIMRDVEGSDHCPVKATFTCAVLPASKCPSLCTKYLPQFAGKQQKLSGFFIKKATSSRNQLVECTPETSLPIASSSSVVLCGGSPSDLDELERTPSQRSVTLDDTGSQWTPNSSGNSLSSCPLTTDSQDDRRFLSSTKRPLSESVSRAVKKLKKEAPPPSAGKQSNLLSFFNKATSKLTPAPTRTPLQMPSVAETSTPTTNSRQTSISLSEEKADDTIRDVSSGVLASESSKSSAWKELLRGPLPAPLCKGHKEPCVLRTVKKDGANKGKQFWVCCRPEGHKTNPEARCDYFVWVTKK